MFMSTFLELSDEQPTLHFEQVAFSHPLFIMYSSGTTGAPKCMVHSVGVCISGVFFGFFVVFCKLVALC